MITNTVPDFLEKYENTLMNISDLEEYYNKYPNVFVEYFNYHCPNTPERLTTAISRYPGKINDIKIISKTLPVIIEDILSAFNMLFDMELELQFNIFVGGFGSNAFVEKKIIGQVYFAAEKLSVKPGHLRVIVAHEIGHIFHNAIASRNQMQWGEVDWTNGLISLYREGVATYLSQTVVKDFGEEIYFSYDDLGENWLAFSKENIQMIKARFVKDALSGWNSEKEREWFRLSGGTYFGYNRLGYFLGTSYVNQLVEEMGMNNALTFWCKNDIKKSVVEWLSK